MLDISKNGMSLKSNHTAGGFWKFTSSAVFAATVVTTIGKSVQLDCTLYKIFVGLSTAVLL